MDSGSGNAGRILAGLWVDSSDPLDGVLDVLGGNPGSILCEILCCILGGILRGTLACLSVMLRPPGYHPG